MEDCCVNRSPHQYCFVSNQLRFSNNLFSSIGVLAKALKLLGSRTPPGSVVASEQS